MSYEKNIQILKDKNSQLNEIKIEISKISDNLFDEFREYIFDKYPLLNSFGWTQYTPYFNDGETCVFYANIDYLIINDEYAEDSNWFYNMNVIDWGKWNPITKSYHGRIEEPNEKYNQILFDAHDEIVSFLSNFDNDFFLNKFGDHAEIIVTKSGTDISDYDHE